MLKTRFSLARAKEMSSEFLELIKFTLYFNSSCSQSNSEICETAQIKTHAYTSPLKSLLSEFFTLALKNSDMPKK